MATHATLKFDLTIHDADRVMKAAEELAKANELDPPADLADAIMILIEWPTTPNDDDMEITFGEAVDFEEEPACPECAAVEATHGVCDRHAINSPVRPPMRPTIAFTDSTLVYCPACAVKLGYATADGKPTDKWSPEWQNFIPINTTDDLVDTTCDSCDAEIKDRED